MENFEVELKVKFKTKVSVTANDASDARTKAIEQGHCLIKSNNLNPQIEASNVEQTDQMSLFDYQHSKVSESTQLEMKFA